MYCVNIKNWVLGLKEINLTENATGRKITSTFSIYTFIPNA